MRVFPGRAGTMTGEMCTEPEIVRSDPRYARHPRSDLPAEVAGLWSIDGVFWTAADPPRYEHEHWPQTVGIVRGEECWWCPCDAVARSDHAWVPASVPRTSTMPRGCVVALAVLAVVVAATGVWSIALGSAQQWALGILVMLAGFVCLAVTGLIVERRAR